MDIISLLVVMLLIGIFIMSPKIDADHAKWKARNPSANYYPGNVFSWIFISFVTCCFILFVYLLGGFKP